MRSAAKTTANEPTANQLDLLDQAGPLARQVCGPTETIAKLGVSRTRSVTERFVLGLAAAAQGDAVADFVGLAIGANGRDAPAHPQRAALRKP